MDRWRPAGDSGSPQAGPCRIRRAAALQTQGKGHESVSAALDLHPGPVALAFVQWQESEGLRPNVANLSLA